MSYGSHLNQSIVSILLLYFCAFLCHTLILFSLDFKFLSEISFLLHLIWAIMGERNKQESHLNYVGIKFCKECNNMLYPKEDSVNKRLLYACRNCGYSEPSKKSCVYVNNMTENYDELRCINTDIIQDPTLPRSNTHLCPKCRNKEAVFFQSYNRTTLENEMKLYYVCTNTECCHRWTQ